MLTRCSHGRRPARHSCSAHESLRSDGAAVRWISKYSRIYVTNLMRLPPSEKGPIALGFQGPVHENEPLDIVLLGLSMFLKLAKGMVALDMSRVYGPWLSNIQCLFMGVFRRSSHSRKKRV